MEFISFSGGGDDEAKFRFSRTVTPGEIAEMDQARAEYTDLFQQILTMVVNHLLLVTEDHRDNHAVTVNAGHLAKQFLSLDRGQAIGVISLAIEKLANMAIEDLGGLESAREQFDLDEFKKLARDIALEEEE